MRLSVLLTAITLVLCSFFGNSQTYNGYFGKKNFIEISTVSSSPLVRNLLIYRKTPGFRAENGELVPGGKYWFSSGIHITGGRAIKKNLIVGFEYGLDRWKTVGTFIPYNDYNDLVQSNVPDYLVHEDMVMQRTIFMPKVEFSRANGLLPMGLSYCLGLGLSTVKVIEKDYLFAASYGDIYGSTYSLMTLPESESIQSSDVINYERRYRGLQIMGGIKMRMPVSTWLMMTYGVRYMIDIKFYNTHGYSTNHYVSQRAAKGVLYNFISLDIGFTVPF